MSARGFASDHNASVHPEVMAALAEQHHAQPAVVSITQSTESGTVSTPGEVAAIGALARERGMRLHVDGARLAARRTA